MGRIVLSSLYLMGTRRLSPSNQAVPRPAIANQAKKPPLPASGRAKPLRSSAKPSLAKSHSAKFKPGRKSQAWGAWWAMAIVVLASAGIASCGWLGLQLIVNPKAISWLNQLLPGWVPNYRSAEPTRTLQEIRAEIRKAGLISAEPLMLGKGVSYLDGKTTTTDLLVPVIKTQPDCTSDCDRIVELRVYQSATDVPKTPTTEESFHLVNQLAIGGLEESFVIAPFVDANSANQGSSRVLPLTTLTRFETGASFGGVWLNLSSTRSRGDETAAYGQILYYNPSHHHLDIKLQWTSPTAEPPIWKQVTGSKLPELIVNQTMGMEPQFEIYQVKPLNFLPSPVQLEQISLAAPALDHPSYDRALLLARNRLWSPSLQWLQSLRQSLPSIQWSAAAQAQLDLVRWHALVSQNQADGSWSSPSQQVLANLIDGRWERALTVYESSIDASHETAGLLRGDGGRLANRVKAALEVSPTKLAVKAWGTLLVAAQQNPTAAIAWLKKQPKTTPADVNRIISLIPRLDPAFAAIEDNTLKNTPRDRTKPHQDQEKTAPGNGNQPEQQLDRENKD